MQIYINYEYVTYILFIYLISFWGLAESKNEFRRNTARFSEWGTGHF